jgi:hypothetical protein
VAGKKNQQEEKHQQEVVKNKMLESPNFLLSIGGIVASLAVSYATTRATQAGHTKTIDDHARKIENHDKEQEKINIKLAATVSRDHVYDKFVTKEELKLNLENISIKQDIIARKQDTLNETQKQILDALKQKGNL